MREHIAALLNCIDTSLRANRESLEAISGCLNSGDRIEWEANLTQILDMETLIDFCIQAGQTIAFRRTLIEAAGEVLAEKAPLIVSLLSGVGKQLPNEIPEKDEIKRLRKVASSIGVVGEPDMEWMHSIMEEAGTSGDSSWSLLPYLCAALMASNIWSTTSYNVNTGGFNNNVHCLARCINAVIAGSEFVRLERTELQRQSHSNGHASEMSEPEIPSRVSVEANIKSAMQLYVKCAAVIVLDSWSDNNRSHIIPKLIFLDHLCDLSPYLPRSSLEIHVPYAILQSLYQQHYGVSSPVILPELLAPSPRQSPLISRAHASPSVRHHRCGDSTPRSNAQDSGDFNVPGQHQDAGCEKQQRRRSGPLEYGSGRKVEFVEGSSSGGQGPSPLPRFAVSRSGPLLYK